MGEYQQLPQDSVPEAGLTNLSVISTSDIAGKKNHLLWFLDESIIEIEDEELLLILNKLFTFLFT